ncbi:MAG: DegQ family serine endoprotease [Rhizobiaceae bacterium]|nr:DegQ family serine endoprotease [Rhizobiaceae bacterium]
MRSFRMAGIVAIALVISGSIWSATQSQELPGVDKLRGVVAEILGKDPKQAEQQAQDRLTPPSQAVLQYSFAPLVKSAAPAVVNVYAERMVRQQSPFGGDPFFERFFGQQMPGRTRKQSALGSGVIVHSSGIIVTNNHVIDGADEIKVALADGREFPSRLLLKDERVDLAILKIDDSDAFASLGYSDSDRLEVGDLVLAIGNPFGVGQTVTSGIVSALARNGVGVSDFGFFIQTDAAINPGNSGGALLDMNGRLVGINTAIFSRSGGSNGIGFAIPANMVRAVVDAAMNGDDAFRRPYIGATFSTVTSDMAEALGLDRAAGAIVTAVVDGGPSDNGGLKVGDLVLSLNGLTVDHPDALGYRLATTGVGNIAELEVISRKKIRKVAIKLAPPRQRSPDMEARITGRNPFSGALLADLDPKLAEELHIQSNAKGVIVLDVERGSYASRYGIRPRDIVLEINGHQIKRATDVVEIVKGNPRAWRFELDRNGNRLRQMVR